MKHLKMLGLAAVAAMALMAVIGAGSASATVICKNKTCTEKYSSGQVYEFTATNAELTGGPGVVCEHSLVKLTQSSNGSESTTVTGTINSLTFSGCRTLGFISCTVTSPGNFSGEVHWTTGNNGTVTVSNGSAKVVCPFGGLACVFSKASLSLGITGGNPASVVANKVPLEMTEETGFTECPEEAFWDATYKATKPTAVFIGQK